MYGVFGGQADNRDTGEEGENNYWSDATDQSETASMWSAIAAHYSGNSAVAGYDLLNEPTGTPDNTTYWTLVNGLYNTIRAADPGHICIIEADDVSGTWDTLPAPSMYNWTNVAYEMHEYEFNGTDAQVQHGSANQVTDFQAGAGLNVPVYVGEFNDFQYNDAWQKTIPLWNTYNLSWTTWAYKATHGSGADSWGLYNVAASVPPVPNLMSDSAATISADWTKWTTTNAFSLNPTLSSIVVGNRQDIEPSRPEQVTASPASGSVTLTWAPSPGADSYRVYRSTTPGGEGSTPVVRGITDTSDTNTKLTNGAVYYFRVQAVNSTDASKESSEVSAGPSASYGPVANGAYTLTPQNAANSRIDATGGSTTSGQQVQIWADGPGNPNQDWIFTNEGGSAYKIQPSYDTSLALGIPTGTAANGTPVEMLTDNGAPNERWTLAAATGGYTLTPVSAPGYTMNVSGPSSADGTKLQIWQAIGGTNTVFAFARATAAK